MLLTKNFLIHFGGNVMKKKRLTYDDWTVITSKRYKQMNIDTDFFKGIAALIYIDEVSTPQTWEFNSKTYVVCDNGMKWLQIIPYDDHYAIATMINKRDEIELWYIDMIADYGFDSDDIPYFTDLYLDLVVYPDGAVKVDDMDELIEALEKKIITPHLYELALETSENLQNGILTDIPRLKNLSMSCVNELEHRL